MNPKALAGKVKGLSAGKKVALGVVAAGFISVIAAALLWVRAPEYRLLYGGLSPSDAGDVVTALKEMHVPYKLKNGGRDIYVPQERLYETRIELAKRGIPKGGQPGFEIFDKTSLGMTDFIQKINYQRALEGELARTISSMDEVRWARVHIAIPKESLFVRKSERPKASVLIQLEPGKKLNPSQVEAISFLVASSVPKLEPKDVAIVDTDGNLLSEPGNEGDEGRIVAKNLSIKHQLEAQYEKKVKDILVRLLGPGKSVVKVSLDMDFTKREWTEEIYDPDNTAVVSKQETQELHTGKGSVPVGVPGVLSNLPSGKSFSSSSTSMDKKVTSVVNYEVSKTVRQVKDQLGKIKRISVAVVVDGRYRVSGKARKFVPLSDEELERIRSLVASAVGYSKERGDQIEVSCMPLEGVSQFEESVPTVSEIKAIQKKEWIYRLTVSVAKGLFLVAIAFLFYRVLSKFLSVQESVPEGIKYPTSLEEAEKRVEELEGGKEPERKGLERGVGFDALRGEIEKLAEREPEKVAKVIEAWVQGE